MSIASWDAEMWNLSSTLLFAHCEFDKTANLSTIIFEVFVLASAATTFLLLSRWHKYMGLRVFVTAIGVLIFELFTGPMWMNAKLGPWAYLYYDVSWILTIGWTSLILGVVLVVDHFLASWNEWKRFAVYQALLLALVVIAEIVVVNLGVRSYAPEVREAVSGVNLVGVPVEILFYVPVFTSLVIAFYKYWSFVIDDAALVPVKKRNWVRAVLLAFIAIFLFEVMVEPMAENVGFPAWSYVYHDISIIMIAAWVSIVAITAVVVGRFMIHLPIPLQFLGALMVIGAIALPMESWLITSGYRVYSESAVERFTGFTTPITGVAVEVAFAIPCYLALVIGFIRYWEIVLDNQL